MKKCMAFGFTTSWMAVDIIAFAHTPAKPAEKAPNGDSQYRLVPDSLPQEMVPKGEIRGPFVLPYKVYLGT